MTGAGPGGRPAVVHSRADRLAVSLSFRLGGPDGVSVEASKWQWALRQLGYRVRTVAGAGPVDVTVAGLDAGAWVTGHSAGTLDRPQLRRALAGADIVIVENVCSLPLNPAARDAVAEELAGRPAVLRHHDLPWQRERFKDEPGPPDDPAWRHATINRHSVDELRERGIRATAIRNRFDPDPAPGEREATRRALGITPEELLVVQPTRAIPRKRVDVGLSLAEAVGATYWLLGPAEEGFDEELEGILASAKVDVRRGPVAPMQGWAGVEHAYAAADAVVFPSDNEGFGNPPVEASAHRKPVAVGTYQVGMELKELGFVWFNANCPDEMREFLDQPDRAILDRNHQLVREHLDIHRLPGDIARLVAGG
jgi:glycosyltransferase involved in cell wall biosynthesis